MNRRVVVSLGGIALIGGICIFAFLVLPALIGSKTASSGTDSPPVTGSVERPKVTFIELGSVNCVPCKAMQPIMDEVRRKYGDQVRVVFHDVWTPAGKPYGQEYKIRVIPTQIFLDKDGKEFFRHEGFFPEEELVKILARGGVKL